MIILLLMESDSAEFSLSIEGTDMHMTQRGCCERVDVYISQCGCCGRVDREGWMCVSLSVGAGKGWRRKEGWESV